MKFKYDKPDARWRAELDPQAYRVMREGRTEARFSGQHCQPRAEGMYRCRGCHTPLFDTLAQVDADFGWPCFVEALDAHNLFEETEASYGMLRTELFCKGCGSHLGFIYEDDGPDSPVRFCVNSVALEFVARPG
ncbi:MAG: peptide-methionine (R)-S-oxide reductase [Bradymonadaceae bacterium]|nr:peptide-methionine (R)-S-oxide reductase [Lujinxingiaceae bacterium]